MALVGVALGALVYAWAGRLVSPAGAWVSLVLFVFSPTLLAHGPLVTSDVTAALFFTAAAGALWLAMQRVTTATVAASAVLAAGCLLSKVSGPILVPIALALVAIRVIDGRPLEVAFRGTTIEHIGRARQAIIILGVLAACGLVAWALVWASYGFRYSAFAAATTGKETFLGQPQELPGAVGWLLSTARRFHLLPEAYIYAAGITVQYAAERAAFLNGQFGTTGWWWYFPYAFAVKTTIPALIAGLLAIGALVVQWSRPGDGTSWRQRAWNSLYAGAPLVVLVVIYFGFALTTNLNIGHRHLLPIYPGACDSRRRSRVLDSAVARSVVERAPTAWPTAPQAANACGSATGHATLGHGGRCRRDRGAGMARRGVAGDPPELPGLLQSARGRAVRRYKHLADSSLDWGQDLPALKQWLDRQGLVAKHTKAFISRISGPRVRNTTGSGRRSSPDSSIAARRSRRSRSAAVSIASAPR